MLFHKQKLLYAWISKDAIIEYMRMAADEEQERIEGILSKWDDAKKTLIQIIKKEEGMQNQPSSREMNPLFDEKIRKITLSSSFQKAFRGRDYEFRMVEIDKLITPQVGVYVDFIEHLKSSFPQKITEDFIFDLCLSNSKENARISFLRLNDSTFLYSSDSTDFRVVDIESRPAQEPNPTEASKALPNTALSVILGYGSQIVNVVSSGNKMVLSNGLHRLYALRSAGITHAPALVINNPIQIELSKYLQFDLIMNNPRPPMMKDFFNPELTTEVNLKPRKRALKISIQQELIEVPL